MAEELLGLDFEIHGGGSDLVFPHHENEAAQTAAARGEPLARIWMHNGMVQMGEEKMAKSVGNIALLHEALDEYGRDALVMYFLGGHYRQPLAFSAERLEEARRARATASARPARRLGRGASPADMAAAARALLRRARRRLQHRRGAGRGVRVGARGQPPRRGRGRRRPARDARRARLENLLDATRPRGAPAEVAVDWPRSARRRARRTRLRRGRPPARRDRARAAGRSATARTGPELVRWPARDRLRPQPRARGAARAPRAVREVVGARERARGARGWPAVSDVAVEVGEAQLTGARRLAATTRASAREVDPYPYADADDAARRAPTR